MESHLAQKTRKTIAETATPRTTYSSFIVFMLAMNLGSFRKLFHLLYEEEQDQVDSAYHPNCPMRSRMITL